MAKKGTKKKAAKKKAAKKNTRNTRAKTSSAKTPQVKKTTVTFKCVSHTCVADKGPKIPIGDTKSTVTFKAPSCNVTIQYFDPATGAPLRPPFEETTTTGPIILNKGVPQTFTVRTTAQHHNFYDATCEDCGKVFEPPEMIVP